MADCLGEVHMNQDSPDFTIVMPTLNQAEFLCTAIDSVLSQRTSSLSLQLIVMDGGSTDETLDLLASYGPDIVVTSGKDSGQSDAVNRGLAMATGKISGWLNSDDILKPRALSRVLEEFRDANVEWVFGRVDMIDRDGHEIRRTITGVKNYYLKRLTFRGLLWANWISQMGVFWRTPFLSRTGDLNLDLHLAMDYDLWLRFWRTTPGRYLDATVASFRIHGHSKSSVRYREQLKEARRIASLHANGQYPWLLRFRALQDALVERCYRCDSIIRSLRQSR